MKIITTTAICLALAACAAGGVGHEFTMEQAASIQPGMTLAEVTGILGQPQSLHATQMGTVMSWVYVKPVTITPIPTGGKPTDVRSASFTFVDGKVVAPGSGVAPK